MLIGMVATLMGTGLRVAAVRHNRPVMAKSRTLPGATAASIVAVGLYLMARGSAQIA